MYAYSLFKTYFFNLKTTVDVVAPVEPPNEND